MCKRIEELVADQFRNFTGVVVKDENQLLNLEVFPQKREPFKQLLRNVLPDLRLRSSYGLVTVADFAGYVEKEAGKGLSANDFTDELKAKLDAIAEGANKYEHPTHTAYASGLYKTTVDEQGHVTAAAPVTKTDITGLGIPAQDTTYDEATTTKAGLMSAADKTKLDGMNTTIDKAIANHTATDAEVSEMLAEIYGE